MPVEVSKEKKLITYVWFTIMFWVFFACIVAIVAAHQNDCDANVCSRSKAFAGFWNIFMCVAVFYGGTRIFQRHQNEMSVGLLLGVIFILAMNLFMQGVYFVGLGNDASAAGKDPNADRAMAAFSLILWMLYSTFWVILWKFKEHIIKKKYSASQAKQVTTY
jgi:hypothetical protein